jgi:hypothetical protein
MFDLCIVLSLAVLTAAAVIAMVTGRSQLHQPDRRR